MGTLALGGVPELAVSDEKGHIFVNLEDTSEIVEFDARTSLPSATLRPSRVDQPCRQCSQEPLTLLKLFVGTVVNWMNSL